MAAVVGALRVVLGADSAALDKGLKDAQSSLKNFANGAAQIATGIGLEKLAENLASAFTNSIKHAVQFADEIGKMSQKIGVPVEELSKLKLAANLSDVSLETLGKGIQKLGAKMTEAGSKPTSEAANAFKALGVSVTDSDGKMKTSTAVLSDIAGKFEGLKDGVGKTTVAGALFGKAIGPNLIPLLNSGKDGLEGMKKEAEELGIVISTKTAKAAEAFRDNLTRLSAAKDGIIAKIGEKLLPLLVNLSERFVSLAKQDLSGWAGTIGRVIVGIVEQFELMTERIGRFGVTWEAFKTWISTVPFTEASKKAWENFNGVVEDNRKAMQGIRDTNAYALLADAFGPIATKADKATQSQKDFNYQLKSGKDPLDSFINSQNKSIAAHEAEAEAVGKTTGTKEKLKAVMQAEEIALQNNIALTPQVTAKITELGDRAEASAIKLKGMQLTQEFLSPFDLFNQQMTNLSMLLDRGAISAGTFQQAAFKIKFPSLAQGIKDSTDLNKNLDTLANTAIGSLSSALANIVTGSQSASEAFKAFGKAVLTMLIELIVKAIAFKLISVAINFSSGGGPAESWASINDIPTSGLSNFAGGGAVGPGVGGFVSGPGTGTSDSILARLSNGEFVMNAAATKMFLPLLKTMNAGNIAGMASGGMIGSGLSTSEMVNGQDNSSQRSVAHFSFPGENYSRDMVRGILRTAQELIADGYELKLT